jgi:hypothetical protein
LPWVVIFSRFCGTGTHVKSVVFKAENAGQGA